MNARDNSCSIMCIWTSFTCVRKNVLNDLLHLFKVEVVLWSVARVSIYWSRVKGCYSLTSSCRQCGDKEGSLANILTLIKEKLYVIYLSVGLEQ